MPGASPRTRQRRGVERRNEILEATLAVIGARGVAATTHRAVAVEAGVPLGTVTYYFPTVDTLLEEALRRFVDEETARMRATAGALVGASVSPDDIVDAMIGELARQGPAAAVPQFELYLEAARRPALRAAARDCLDAYAEVAEAALRAAGAGDPRGSAALFVALVDGLGMHQVARPREDHLDRVRTGLRQLFIGLSLDPAESAEWDRRLAAVDVRRQTG